MLNPFLGDSIQVSDSVVESKIAFEHNLANAGVRKWSCIVTTASVVLLLYGIGEAVLNLNSLLVLGSEEVLRE